MCGKGKKSQAKFAEAKVSDIVGDNSLEENKALSKFYENAYSESLNKVPGTMALNVVSATKLVEYLPAPTAPERDQDLIAARAFTLNASCPWLAQVPATRSSISPRGQNSRCVACLFAGRR